MQALVMFGASFAHTTNTSDHLKPNFLFLNYLIVVELLSLCGPEAVKLKPTFSVTLL